MTIFANLVVSQEKKPTVLTIGPRLLNTSNVLKRKYQIDSMDPFMSHFDLWGVYLSLKCTVYLPHKISNKQKTVINIMSSLFTFLLLSLQADLNFNLYVL